MKRVLLVLLVLVLALAGAGVAWLYTPDIPRGELEAKYLRGPQDYVEVDGLRAHVRDDGQGPAIILVHGFASHLMTWDAWAKDLSRDHRVVRFDLPGHGLTGPDPQGYAMDRLPRFVVAVMDRLGIDKATVVGNSLGGYTAWRVAAEHPDRVEKLVLIAAGGFLREGYAYGDAPDLPFYAAVMTWATPPSLVRLTTARLYADPARLTDAAAETYSDMMRAPGVRRALLDRLDSFSVADPLPALRSIRAPTLLMWGAKDPMVPLADAEKFRQAIPDATLVTYQDAGHMPMEEIPERTLKDLRAFLGRD
ncbi:alpha/beta fold hydrolase [Aerophototrophica crusticola]|uniref:Alpha/beta fold hydrolase n=1 Tax=Aerophototrophica crusticola TaxID=1709002 RepID=A0A858RA56_9PROT|nr:alpha/beta fold hydrolase [Rhodospirillaceae bacterium B3]